MKVLRLTPQTRLDLFPGYLWDGESPALTSDMVVCLRQGRIDRIIPQASYRPDGSQQLYLPQLTLLPGLVDAHVHLALDGLDFKTSVDRWQDPEAMSRCIKKQLEAFLEHGVLAIRDGGDASGWNLWARDRAPLEGPVPRIVATGRALHKKGFYGSFLGPPLTPPYDWEGTVKGLAAAGSDQIKVIVSGLVTFRHWGEVGPVQFDVNELRPLVEAAHERGLKVMAHANSDGAVRQAVLAGVDSVEHGYFVSDETLELMAERGTYWAPTVAAVANRLKVGRGREYNPRERDIIKGTVELQLKKIAHAHERGVRLIIGTDAGAPGVYHGRSYEDELSFFLAAGLPPLAVLRAATSVGAGALGLASELGSIAPGKLPYLIAVAGNPLEDPSALQRLEAVILLERA
ncbi:MAG TPA: amidohydrolase [Peptococcaceae bacterium]|nr:MAG: Amidohydrolase [Moorella sp. 60_41]HBT46601.1 amidohydrolase [Peptococcaceae bacterium]